ncbi:hypothetical protein [Labrys sp. WJW]|uniref:hypothetical protein n=1 Tax=Labrys sp. WJW TaxID=1737983 RepID=UPI0012EA7316|nr:hypothetical protein [Labrys sp. WJW]
MQKPTWWSNNLSLGNVITIVMLVFGMGVGWQKLEANDLAAETWRKDRDKAIDELRVKVAPIEGLIYRLGQQEANVAQINARVDRAVDSISDQLKELRKDVGQVGTAVAVLTRSIETQGRRDDALPSTGRPR